MVNPNTLVIAVTGTMTSGKDALNFFLINRGFKFIRLTQPILDELTKRKIPLGKRQKWLDITVEFRRKWGIDVFARKAAKQIKEGERYVISPVRHPADLKFLKRKYKALVFFVDAPFEARYKRTFLKEISNPLTKEEFKQRDQAEDHPEGKLKKYLPNILGCKEVADEIIMNSGDLNELNQKLEKIMRKYSIPDIEDTDYLDGVDT